jgi:hypothetical protein
LLLRYRGYFISFTNIHLQSREQVSETVIFNDHALGEGE